MERKKYRHKCSATQQQQRQQSGREAADWTGSDLSSIAQGKAWADCSRRAHETKQSKKARVPHPENKSMQVRVVAPGPLRRGEGRRNSSGERNSSDVACLGRRRRGFCWEGLAEKTCCGLWGGGCGRDGTLMNH